MSAITLDEPPLRVMSLHALLYCERLFYLEEVEEIRVADAAVYAGRRLHEEVVPLDDESPERRSLEVASEAWGIFGKVDAVRRRDGAWVAYEHKRGRCRRGERNEPLPWPSDRIQAIAYAVLIEEELGEPVREARVRYHAENVTAFVTIDDEARHDLRAAIDRARELRRTTDRPPVHPNEHVCVRCSLAPVCLPEEERLIERTAVSEDVIAAQTVPALFPSNRERHTVHVTAQKAYVSRSSESLVVKTDDGEDRIPIEQIDSLVVHGYGQVTTQAIQLCAHRGVAVQWLTAGGRFAAGLAASPGRVQQRLRQYAALSKPEVRLELARRTVHAKVETQLKYLLRGTRGKPAGRSKCQGELERMRESLSRVNAAASLDSLRGLEGIAAKAYFASLPALLHDGVPPELHPRGRSQHPPRDRFNCLLSFGYGLLFSAVQRTLLSVGLEPALGYFHQPRSSAPPLVLDFMEIFRVPLIDLVAIASVNRGQWHADRDFTISTHSVWLSDLGRKQAIGLFEQRLCESYAHPVTGQSLTYARMLELEARLLEKEWTGAPGLFAKLRLR